MQKNLFICFYILLFISCVISDCPNPFLVDYTKGCTSVLKDGNILTGTLHIPYNQPGYQYTFSPTLESTFEGTNLIYDLVPGINYTLTVVNQENSDCSRVESFLLPNHKYQITYPKCKFSQGKIQFVPAAGYDNTMITASCWDTPCSAIGINAVYFNDNSICTSFLSIPLIPFSTGPTPNIVVKDSYCYKDTGSLDLLNKQDYTSWKLIKSSDNGVVPETSVSSGSWSQLASFVTEGYSLELESDECDIEIVNIDISPSWPSYRFEYNKNDTCPRNSSLKVHFDDPDMFDDGVRVAINQQVIAQGESVYFSQNSTIELKYLYDIDCFQTVSVYPPALIADIQYSIDMCSGPTPIVTLHYDETLYPDVIVTLNNNNNVKSSSLVGSQPTFIADKTFYLNFYQFAYIESPCHFSQITIFAEELTKPIYTLIRAPKYCGDTMDFVVTNYYLFEELTVDNGATHDGHGLFINVSTSDNRIKSKLHGCQVKSNDVNVDYPNTNDHEYEPIVEILSLPTCLGSSLGRASYRLVDHKNNRESEIHYFTFESDGSSYYPSTYFQGCDNEYSNRWISPPGIYNNKIHNTTGIIEVVRNSKCYYDMTGSITIDTTTLGNVPYFNIGEVGYSPSSTSGSIKTFMGLHYGHQTIKIHDGPYCTVEADIFIPSDSDWVFPATITPVSGDCLSMNGKITFDSSIFSFVTPAGNYEDISSGHFDIIFALANNTCSGLATIYVPTSTPVDLSYTVGQSPSCENANDGNVLITLKVNNQEITPSSIVDYQRNSLAENTPLYSSLYSGDTNLTVYHSFCSWPLTVTLTEQDPQIQYQHVADVMDGCDQRTLTKFSSSNENITITSVQTLDFDVHRYISNIYAYPSLFQPSSKFIVAYNDHCFKTIDVESKSIDMEEQIQWPTSVTIENNDCSDPSTQSSLVKVVNPGNMELYYSDNYFSDKFYAHGSFNSFSLTARERFTGCTRYFEATRGNKPSSKVVKKSTCPGSYDGTIETTYDHTKETYVVISSGLTNFESRYAAVARDNSTANIYNNIDSGSYIILRSPKNNPFCQLVDEFDIVSEEPTVQLSSIGSCDASDSAIGDTGMITNTLSITTSNVTYNINGVVSNDPVFKGLSSGDYNSIVTINNTVCHRVIKNSITVPQLPSLSVVVDTSTCMNAVINPSRSDIQHQFVIKDSTGTTVSYGERTGSFSFIASIKDTYSISISDMSNTCLFKTSFTITECTTPTPEPTETPMPSSSIKLSPSSSLFYIYCIFLFVFAILRI